jgi:hypothetical protein
MPNKSTPYTADGMRSRAASVNPMVLNMTNTAIVNTAVNNAATAPADKVQYIKFDGTAFIDASMVKHKGAALGIATFNAYAGLFSQCLNGGMRAELSATTAHHTAKVHTAPAKELTATGKAFIKIAESVLAICKATGKPKTQDAHDTALLEISALWATQFKDAAPRVKSSEPTQSQIIAALKAENAALKVDLAIAHAKLEAKADKAAPAFNP